MSDFRVTISLDPLFKYDSKLKLRMWKMELGVASDGVTYAHRTIAGLEDGEKVESGWKIAKPKNVGRANETSSEDQAKAEINSQYKKKQDKDYRYNPNDLKTVDLIKPMLAHDYKKNTSYVSFPAIAQPKLDGIRCLAPKHGLFTRTGKAITSCEHVAKEVAAIHEAHPDLILDGELYNHELKENFNKITSLVRKQKQSDADKQEISGLVQYHVYDIVNSATAVERQELINKIKDIVSRDNPVIRFVTSRIVYSQEELDNLYGEWLELGYEGQMVRQLKARYASNRSKDLLKRKEFISEEFEVLEILEGQGNWAGCVKHLKLKLPDGRIFQSGIRGEKDMLRRMWEDQVPPKWATIRFFQYTPDGIPRFPVAIDWGYMDKRDD